ncbi:MFS transporter [Acinetobacter halotolerans]|uniref:MFS transporter n=1 Tax=Acinetobacter halotolerans TaxID=1752076 RepID=A0A4Q6X6C3_9GAMM|nr:MFS transporter [Acinetobacter halotolerans]RZF49792.1 MFS transporter [Acinetobacter halotolerans]
MTQCSFGRSFYFVQFSAILNSIASRCIHLALAWWVLSITHHATSFVVFVAIGTAADLLARGLFGSLGDIYDKQRLISICYWMSLISAIIIALLATTHTYLAIVLFICQALGGLAIGIREPLQSSIVPFQVSKEQLSSAIQWRSAAMTIVTFCSPILGTGLISIIGPHNTIWFSVGLILLSILLLNSVKLLNISSEISSKFKRPKWYSGFSAIKQLPPEISLIKITFFINLGLFPFFSVALPTYFYQNYSKSPWLFGIVDTFFAIGMFLGATKFGTLANSFFGRAITTYSGYLALSLGILISAIMSQVLYVFHLGYFSLMCFGMCIAGCGLMVAVTNTSFMRSAAVPHHFLNRVSASSTFGTSIANPIGLVISGICISSFGINATLILLSLILLTASTLSFLSVNLRQVLSLSDNEIHGAYSRMYPKAFSKDISTTKILS